MAGAEVTRLKIKGIWRLLMSSHTERILNVKKYAAPDGALFLILMRLQLWRTYGAKVMEKFFRLIKIAMPLAIVSMCLFGYVLNSHSGIFREFQAALLSVQWALLACLAVWCGSFLFMTFSRRDLPLIGLLVIAIAAFFIGYAESFQTSDAIILLAGVTLGKGMRFALEADGRWKMEDGAEKEVRSQKSEVGNTVTERVTPHLSLVTFLVGLVVLLAFASWWHLDVAHNFYPGTRWTGLWDNPNDYGMLMGAGVVLTAGLLLADRRWKMEDGEPARSQKSGVRSQNKENQKAENEKRKEGESADCDDGRRLFSFSLLRKSVKSADKNVSGGTPDTARGTRALPIILFFAAGMMEMGLFFSCSRGAWLATAVGLLYLAKAYGRFKWRFVVTGFGLVALGILLFWGRTPDNAPWYLKRMDFGRASAQHRVAAWKAGFEMMRDHPFGVGWNNALNVYDKNYSLPENGAAAITMNSYLMLGTELGIPALVCFLAYVALALKGDRRWKLGDGKKFPHLTLPHPQPLSNPIREGSQTACRAGAVVLLVAFWFDGGLFTLATASVFWILLELGSEKQKTENRRRTAISTPHPTSPPAPLQSD